MEWHSQDKHLRIQQDMGYFWLYDMVGMVGAYKSLNAAKACARKHFSLGIRWQKQPTQAEGDK